jgi:hypothetical protein
LRNRHGEGFADQATDGFQLTCHHFDGRAARGSIEMVGREPQHSLVKLVAQSAEHVLAYLPLIHADKKLELTIDSDEN